MARRWSHLVVIHSSVLVGELTTPGNALMEKVYAGPHTISAWLLASVNLGLHLKRLSIAVLRIQIIQVLGTIRLLLSAGRPLPLFKLLEGPPLFVMDRDNGLAEPLSHQRLELIFDLWLLLFEIVRLENRRSSLL